MMLAMPAAGALLGGALFSWGTTAMSVGWLVGSWLYGATSKSTTPGMKPNQMPTLNQSLRGSPLFVTFGTNRISAQIVWTKHWKAERMKTSGKGAGKGGGSGGAGAAKGGGSAAQSYTYSWDIMFSFGMTDLPSYIKQGWIGGDAMEKSTVRALLAGWPNAQNQIDSLFIDNAAVHTKNKPKAKLDFTECWFMPALPTGDPDIDIWSYFQSQESVDCVWPYTVSLGFKTLQLGQSGMVPQLSFEIGPIAADSTIEPAFVNQDIVGTDLTTQNPFWCGTAYVIANSKHWIANANIDATYAFGLIAVEDGTKVRLTTTQLNLDSPIGSGYVSKVIFGVPGTPYIYVFLNSITAPEKNYIMVYQLNTDQTLSMISASSNGLRWSSQALVTMTVCGVGVVDGNVYVAGIGGIGLSTDKLSLLWSLGAAGTAPDGDGTAAYWDNNIVVNKTATLGDYFYAALRTGGAGIYEPIATFVDDGAGGYNVLTYVSKYLIDNIPAGSYGSQSLIATLGATYPNGFTVDKNGAAIFGSFDDAGKHSDGTAGENVKADYVSPSYQVYNGTSYLIWGKQYWNTVSIGTYGNACRVRIYTWDGNAQTEFANSVTHLFADSADIGVDNSDDTDLQHSLPRGTQFYIDDDGVIRYTISYTGIESITARYIHGTVGVITAATTDVTPPYIIYRILTSDIYGFNVPTTRIDLASYLEAVAHCESEGILVSVTYTTADNFLSIVDELLSLYGGYLVDSGGIIKFGVVRSSDVADSVVVDNHRLLSPGPGHAPVTVSKGAIQDGYNKVKFNYIDRRIDYKQNQIEVSDEVDIDLNGPRVKEFPATYVMAGSLAQMEAERALWTNLYGRDVYNFKLGAKDAHRGPGDVITLVDSYHPSLRSGVTVRIMKWKEIKRLEFDVQAVQIFDYQNTANHDFTITTSGDPGNDLVQDVLAPRAQRAYELPKEFQSKPQCYIGYNQASAIMGAQLHMSFDGGASFILTQDVQPFIISGQLAATLEARDTGWCETDVRLRLMPASGWSAATPTWAQTHDLDDVTEGIRAAGGGVIVVGSEAIALQNLTLISQNEYRAQYMFRGWGGTPISQHNSGEFWNYHAAGIFQYDISEDKIGTSFQYKVVPYNFAGQLYDIASIQAGSYEIKGLYWLPRLMPDVRVWVQSPEAWTRSLNWQGSQLKVISGGCDIIFTWPHASNIEGYGFGGYGAGGFGHFADEIDGTQFWRFQVQSSNGVTVHSEVCYNSSVTYTRQQNSADFSGFAGDARFLVTPYNGFGDAPGSGSLKQPRLFW